MNRENFSLEFSKRLNFLLKNKGCISKNAISGVKVSELAAAIGCSMQIVRRYTVGTSLPEYHIILKIAQWFNVSPGWLLFGDDVVVDRADNVESYDRISIDFDVLKYILTQTVFIQDFTNKEETVPFLMDVIKDAAHLKANKKIILKLIDVAINSATRFKNINRINDFKEETNAKITK